MQFPGVVPLVFFLFLVPVLIPIIQQFWPTNTVWWAAILVAVLGALASALRLVYQAKLSKVGMPTPAGTPMDSGDYSLNTRIPTKPTAMRKFWLG